MDRLIFVMTIITAFTFCQSMAAPFIFSTVDGQFITFDGTTNTSICAEKFVIFVSSDRRSVKCRCPEGHVYVYGTKGWWAVEPNRCEPSPLATDKPQENMEVTLSTELYACIGIIVFLLLIIAILAMVMWRKLCNRKRKFTDSKAKTSCTNMQYFSDTIKEKPATAPLYLQTVYQGYQ